MAEEELIKSIWIGKEFISIGDTRIVGEQIHFRKMGLFSRFSPIAANASKIMFQERKLYDPHEGATDIRVRVYFADLRLDKYYAVANPQDINAIAHLRRENEAMQLEIERLYQMLMDASGEDRFKKRIQKQMDDWNKVRGYWSGGGGGGYGLGSSYMNGSVFGSNYGSNTGGEENFN